MSKTNKILFVISCVLIALSLYLSIQISYAVPQFEKLFKSFGTELTDKTNNILKYHYLGLILPFIALIASIYFIKSTLKQSHKNIFYALSAITFVVTLSFQTSVSEAMYAPIMNMKAK